MARVTLTFRKGIKSDPNNHRFIFVIPVISKILKKKIVRDQLYPLPKR